MKRIPVIVEYMPKGMFTYEASCDLAAFSRANATIIGFSEHSPEHAVRQLERLLGDLNIEGELVVKQSTPGFPASEGKTRKAQLTAMKPKPAAP